MSLKLFFADIANHLDCEQTTALKHKLHLNLNF